MTLPIFCEKCTQTGRRALADYVLLAEEESLAPFADAPNRQALDFLQWHRLCAPHHAELPDDARMAYVPTAYAGAES